MKRICLSFVALSIVGLAAISVTAQPRPQTTAPRPTPTPFPRPSPTPLPRPPATQAASPAPVPFSKIAMIDTSVFGDEKSGIWIYVDASKRIQAEFKTRTDELDNIQNRLNTISNELDALMKAPTPDQRAIQAKQQQGESLQNEGKTKKDRLDEDVRKRYQELISPISAQIGAAMDQFATQRGVTMTLDMSKMLPAILTAVPGVDLTQAFIDDFNSKHPRTPGPRP